VTVVSNDSSASWTFEPVILARAQARLRDAVPKPQRQLQANDCWNTLRLKLRNRLGTRAYRIQYLNTIADKVHHASIKQRFAQSCYAMPKGSAKMLGSMLDRAHTQPLRARRSLLLVEPKTVSCGSASSGQWIDCFNRWTAISSRTSSSTYSLFQFL